MGLTEPGLTVIAKPFSFLSHCKVSCGSPRYASVFGEDT